MLEERVKLAASATRKALWMRRVFNSIALLTTFLLFSSLMSIKLSCVYFSLYSVFILCGLPQESSTDFPCFLPFLICWSLSCHLRPRLKLPLFYLRVCYIHHLFVFSSLLLLLIVSLKIYIFFPVLAVLLWWVLWKPNLLTVYSFCTFKTLCMMSTINPKHTTKTGHLGLTACKNW